MHNAVGLTELLGASALQYFDGHQVPLCFQTCQKMLLLCWAGL